MRSLLLLLRLPVLGWAIAGCLLVTSWVSLSWCDLLKTNHALHRFPETEPQYEENGWDVRDMVRPLMGCVILDKLCAIDHSTHLWDTDSNKTIFNMPWVLNLSKIMAKNIQQSSQVCFVVLPLFKISWTLAFDGVTLLDLWCQGLSLALCTHYPWSLPLYPQSSCPVYI